MRDYELIVELEMDSVPDSEDFKDCVISGFVDYCKKHPDNKIDVKYMCLKLAEQTLAHRDAFGNWHLPTVPQKKRVAVKRVLRKR